MKNNIYYFGKKILKYIERCPNSLDKNYNTSEKIKNHVKTLSELKKYILFKNLDYLIDSNKKTTPLLHEERTFQLNLKKTRLLNLISELKHNHVREINNIEREIDNIFKYYDDYKI